VERSGLAKGLAGTYSRGDVGTLEKHLAELGRVGPDALHLYCELALRSIPLGLERGGYDENRAEAMRVLLRRALAQPPAQASTSAGSPGAGASASGTLPSEGIKTSGT
jgi:hypothetical protein